MIWGNTLVFHTQVHEYHTAYLGALLAFIDKNEGKDTQGQGEQCGFRV